MYVSKKNWYQKIRSGNWFSYRYYWFVLGCFIASLIGTQFFIYQKKDSADNCNSSALNVIASIDHQLSNCCSCSKLPVFGLDWETTLNNPCSDSSWIISNDHTQLRFIISDSKNCGGNCDATQSGSAIANITVGDKDVFLSIDFYGVGELQEPNFEKIRFTLDNQVVAVAHAAGGERGCEFGPVVKKYLIEQPYKLLQRTNHKLDVFFTTNDPLFHKNCFYQVNLNFN